MKSFELLGDEKEGVDMLEWWKLHSNMFPLLSFLARIVFTVSAASSKSERVFSAAGSVISPRRTRLNPDKVEDLLTIKLNLALLINMEGGGSSGGSSNKSVISCLI